MNTLSRRLLLTMPAAALATGAHAAQFPRPLAPVAFTWPDGSKGDWKKYAGKVLAVEFIITSCQACHRSGKILEGYYKEFKGQGLQVIALATNDNAQRDIATFLAGSGATFPVGIVARDKAQEFLQHPMASIFYVPQTALVDRKGMVRYQHGGKLQTPPDDDIKMRNEIVELLKAK